MWIRLSDPEYEASLARRKRSRLRTRVLAPPMIWGAMTLFFKYLGVDSRYEQVQRELEWVEAAGLAGGLTLIACVALIFFGRANRDAGMRICPECHSILEPQQDDLLLCACGGTLEPIDRWQWRDTP